MKKLTAFLSLIILLIPLSQKATHLAGAEMWYEHVGGPNSLTYKVYLHVYRDFTNGNPFCTNCTCVPTLCYSANGQGSFTQNFVLQNWNLQPGSDTLIGSEACAIQVPKIDACVPQSSVGIEIYRFVATVTLPGRSAEWKFAWDDYARNNAVSNLTSPGTRSLYIETKLNNLAVFGPNSSPYFTVPAAKSFCVGSKFFWSQAAVDPDGDSLYYDLGNPLSVTSTGDCNDPPQNIPFVNGYSKNQPMTTLNGITIDHKTGTFIFTPSQIEVDVVNVTISEFRFDSIALQYVLIGTTVRDLQIPIVQNCSPTIALGPQIDVSAAPARSDTICSDSLLRFGLSSIGNNEIPNTSCYDIPVIPYSCFDSLITVKFVDPVYCHTISPDGTNFRLIGPDSKPRPIIGVLDQCKPDLSTSEIKLRLHERLDVNGPYLLYTKTALNGTNIQNECGFPIKKFFAMIIEVGNCPDLSYKLENVTVLGDTVIEINWNVDQDPSNPYLREDIFNSWNILRVNNGVEYPIAQVPNINARTFVDPTLRPEQLDYENFTYSVQLVQNNDYKEPTNYITNILLQAAERQVSDHEKELKLHWTGYNGWNNPYYQMHIGKFDPLNNTIPIWEAYGQKDKNYFENTYLVNNSEQSEVGLYGIKVVGTDEENPANLYRSTSNWIYFKRDYLDIPDNTLVSLNSPNMFSPNNDGYNDRFYIAGFNGNREYEDISLSVYNRWGQLVFEDAEFAKNNNSVEGWDGTDINTGKKLVDGVYYYILKLHDPVSSTSKNVQGSVTILTHGSN